MAFGVSHSNNAEYRAVRGQEEPLFNKIASLYTKIISPKIAIVS